MIASKQADLSLLREQFPLLNQTAHGQPLVYLDSSVTSQKPQCVIDAVKNYYENNNANVHRGVYQLAARATKLFENARKTVQEFIHAKHAHEIIFTRGTTESINLVAHSYGALLSEGDQIILSGMEHHSNIVPWQLVANQKGLQLKVIPVTDAGELDLAAYEDLFTEKTKLVALTHASNALGTINPVKEMIATAHAHNVPVLLDGAQAFPHLPVDVQDLDCDFYAFSSHKAYGPTGVGVLYGKTALLEKMPPYQGGGDMIETVTFEKTTFNKLPNKFEAGTPNSAGVIGFAAAIQFIKEIGMQHIMAHEQALLAYATKALKQIPGLTIIGNAKNKLGVISFVMSDAHPHDIATVLDVNGIAVRAGHHCAMPLMQRFQVPATVRVSFGLYNHFSDVDALVQGLHEVKKVFA